MKPSTREVIRKADIAVSNLSSDGGYLNPMQANRFIDLIIDEPTIFNSIRTVRMTAPQMKIEKIGFGSRILRKAPASGEYLPANDRSKPDLGKVELNTKEIIAEVHIPYDVLEDNIERDNMESTIMGHIAKRAALDLEELLISGDTSHATDSYLALIDGLLVQTTTNVADVTGANSAISKTIFKQGLLSMPTKYLRNRAALKFWCSVDNETEYRDSLADRETALGDGMIEGFRPVFSYGVPVIPTALMPSDTILFTHPLNIVWGVQRQIMVETDKDIRARVYVIVLTMRIDMKYETEDAVVKIIGVNETE